MRHRTGIGCFPQEWRVARFLRGGSGAQNGSFRCDPGPLRGPRPPPRRGDSDEELAKIITLDPAHRDRPITDDAARADGVDLHDAERPREAPVDDEQGREVGDRVAGLEVIGHELGAVGVALVRAGAQGGVFPGLSRGAVGGPSCVRDTTPASESGAASNLEAFGSAEGQPSSPPRRWTLPGSG